VPANAVPHRWSHHVRVDDPPIFRELVAYSRGPMDQLAGRFTELLSESELPLLRAHDLPHAALAQQTAGARWRLPTLAGSSPSYLAGARSRQEDSTCTGH